MSDGPCIVSLIVEEVVELVQEVADDCCLVVVDVVGLAQEVAGHCCFIDEGVELVQEMPGIYCLVVEGLVELQGQPLSRIDDALDTIPMHLATPLPPPPPPLTPTATSLIAFVIVARLVSPFGASRKKT